MAWPLLLTKLVTLTAPPKQGKINWAWLAEYLPRYLTVARNLHTFLMDQWWKRLTLGNPEDRAGLGDEGRHPAHWLSEVLTEILREWG